VTFCGHSDDAARRAGRLGAGFFPDTGSHAVLRRLHLLARETAEKFGNDPATIEFTSGGYGVFGPNALDEAQKLSDIGVERIVVPSFLFFKDTENLIAQYGEEVIQKAQSL
jgi:alkanesulfonate monooxygenase SsuD/methylene tetrahydromethanopterin reductase-like flavin-dependent oxidoreductase (luciferase family)